MSRIKTRFTSIKNLWLSVMEGDFVPNKTVVQCGAEGLPMIVQNVVRCIGFCGFDHGDLKGMKCYQFVVNLTIPGLNTRESINVSHYDLAINMVPVTKCDLYVTF